MSLRRLVVLVALLLTVGGCGSDEESPAVSLTAGGKTVTTQAAAYCSEGGRVDTTPPPDDCTEAGATAQAVEAAPGTDVKVIVPDEVAGKGWRIALLSTAGDTAGYSASKGQSALTFTVPLYGAATRIYVEVVQLLPNGPADGSGGVWKFFLDRP